MKRVVLMLALLAGGVGFVLLTTGADSGSSGQPKYWVEFDNAFGLIAGADFKVAGTRAGKLTELKLDRRTKRALVGIQVTDPSFGKLKADVTCESKPQSLIGEYFIDCQPGRAKADLKPGSTIPVSRTYSTIPPDLVNNILRLPERQRLRIILNELGAGVAGRGDDLNAALRRAVPALRDTDRLLAVLAAQSRTLRDLTANGDRVITALANNKKDVGRFISESRDTAQASAERRVELAATFRKLPAFLEELQPTLRQLGRVADAQTPALRDLNASATELKTFFDELGPFADASRPAFRSLGEVSVIGRQTVKAAKPSVAELRRFAAKTPELGKNLAIVLEDLDNRNRAVEPNPRSPGGKGYTGLEALLQYVFQQSQAVNIFDQNGHILSVMLFGNKCAPYRSAEGLKKREAELKNCISALGPNQPGINQPDPTANAATQSQLRSQARKVDQATQIINQATQQAGTQQAGGGGSGKPPIDIKKTVENLLKGKLPKVPGLPNLGNLPTNAPNGAPLSPEQANALLDYLLGP